MGSDTMRSTGLPFGDASSFKDSIDEVYRRATTTPATDFHTIQRTTSNFAPGAYLNTPQTQDLSLQGTAALGYYGAYPTQASPVTPTRLPAHNIPPINFGNTNNANTNARSVFDTGPIEASSPAPEASPSRRPKKKPKQVLEKKHPCDWKGEGGPCGRFFSCPHNVKQHIREKHSNERPYKCDHCTSAFPRPYSMYRHVKQVHGRDIGPGRGRGQTSKHRKQHKANVRRQRPDVAKEESDQVATQPSPAYLPMLSEVEFDMLPAAQNAAFYEQFQPADGSNHPIHESTNPVVDPYDGPGYFDHGILQASDGTDNGLPPNSIAQQQQLAHPSQPAAQMNGDDFDFNFDIFGAGFDLLNLNSPELMDSNPPFPQDSRVKCGSCSEDFDDQQEVIEHMHMAHGLSRDDACSCWGCQLRKGSRQVDDEKAAKEAQSGGGGFDWDQWLSVE